MNTDIIKNKLTEHIGKEATIKYNLGRNKYECYDVVIKKIYNKVFLVEEKCNNILSFSYSDVITKTIKIDFK